MILSRKIFCFRPVKRCVQAWRWFLRWMEVWGEAAGFPRLWEEHGFGFQITYYENPQDWGHLWWGFSKFKPARRILESFQFPCVKSLDMMSLNLVGPVWQIMPVKSSQLSIVKWEVGARFKRPRNPRTAGNEYTSCNGRRTPADPSNADFLYPKISGHFGRNNQPSLRNYFLLFRYFKSM